MRVVSKIVVLATLFVTAVACIDAPVYRPGVSPDDEARELHLFVDVPAAGQSAATRAVTAIEENTIRTVDVLAFRVDGANETFDYAATATATSTSTPGATTQAFVTSLRMRSYPQRFVLVTNARQQVQSVVGSAAQGTPKATLLSQLRFDLATGQDRWTAAGSQNYTPIPMWGESAPETVSSATRNLTSTILLMRMVARLDVRLDAGVVGLADAHSAELNPSTPHPVIHLMPEQSGVEDVGGTLRLGSYPCVLDKASKAFELYGEETIHERHRHRYEVNNNYRNDLIDNGALLSGLHIRHAVRLFSHVCRYAHAHLPAGPYNCYFFHLQIIN